MTSLIVYSNPIEQFVWEGLMSVGFWVFAASAFVSMAVLFQLQSYIIKRTSKQPSWRTWIRSASCDKMLIAISMGIAVMTFIAVM